MTDLSRALVDYLGFGSAAWPQENWVAFAELSAADRAKAEEVLAFAGNCEAEGGDLVDDANSVRAAVKQQFPLLSDEASDAVAWAWSYWSK